MFSAREKPVVAGPYPPIRIWIGLLIRLGSCRLLCADLRDGFLHANSCRLASSVAEDARFSIALHADGPADGPCKLVAAANRSVRKAPYFCCRSALTGLASASRSIGRCRVLLRDPKRRKRVAMPAFGPHNLRGINSVCRANAASC